MKNNKNNILSVSIGIPVYNEEQNIFHVTQSILSQAHKNFELEKIIIISDGSTDKTCQIVKKMQKKYSNIELIMSKSRLGKSARLNQLHTKNTSDILVTIDADVILYSLTTLEDMLSHFSNDKIGLVGGNKLPIKPKTLAAKLITAWYYFFYEIRKDFHKGNNIYNVSASFLAVRNKIAKNIQYPKDLIGTASYIYLSTLRMKYSFSFAEHAFILFRLPDNFSDYFLQEFRSTSEKTYNKRLFGSWIENEYTIPVIYRRKKLLMMIKKPHRLIYVFLFMIYLKFFAAQKNHISSVKNGTWEYANSTKLPIIPSYIHYKR